MKKRKSVEQTSFFHRCKQKIAQSFDWAALSLLLQSAGNLTGTQATGAGVDITGRTVDYRFHSFYVGFPSTVGAAVRVRNLDTKRYTFAAAITFCHCTAPPLFK